ncbi:MAG: hypothetical protein ACYTFG_16970, partial [Planctomycetota bacterium]
MDEKDSRSEGKEAAPPRKKRRHIFRNVFLVLFVLSALLTGGAYLFRRPLFEDLIIRNATRLLRDEAGLEVSILSVEGSYLTGF